MTNTKDYIKEFRRELTFISSIVDAEQGKRLESFLIQSIEAAEKRGREALRREILDNSAWNAPGCNLCRRNYLFIYHSLSPQEDTKSNIGQLRQWLNEDRITDPKKMVTNEEIETMLEAIK